MKLRELLAKVDLHQPEHSALDLEINQVRTNSHACEQGDLFIGMPGTRVDGGEFWRSAIRQGAIAGCTFKDGDRLFLVYKSCWILTVG